MIFACGENGPAGRRYLPTAVATGHSLRFHPFPPPGNPPIPVPCGPKRYISVGALLGGKGVRHPWRREKRPPLMGRRVPQPPALPAHRGSASAGNRKPGAFAQAKERIRASPRESEGASFAHPSAPGRKNGCAVARAYLRKF